MSAGDIFAIIAVCDHGHERRDHGFLRHHHVPPRAQVAAGRIGQVMDAEGMGDPSVGKTAALSGDIAL